jgi:D-amino peptidase
VAEAMKNIKTFEPTVEKGSVELEVSLSISGMADMALLIPGTIKKDGRTVIYTAKDYMDAFKAFRAMLVLSSGIR